uniref:Uncharacterized protein n=1 Tax=Chrysotila carterae TaxID=13221 RepID=A0A7S4BIX4_CHRCT
MICFSSVKLTSLDSLRLAMKIISSATALLTPSAATRCDARTPPVDESASFLRPGFLTPAATSELNQSLSWSISQTARLMIATSASTSSRAREPMPSQSTCSKTSENVSSSRRMPMPSRSATT